VALAIPSVLLAGVVGYAATSPALTSNASLLNGAPCTVTLSGASYSGTCSGAFVQPTATPSPTPTFTIAQSNQQLFTMAASFTPSLPGASHAGSSLVLLVSAAGDGNSSFGLPAGWLRVADVTDGNPVGLHLFYYPNAPAATSFGVFTQSPAANVAYTIAEVGANLSLDRTGTATSGATAVGSLTARLSAPTSAPAEIVFAGFGASQGATPQSWGAPGGFSLVNKQDSNTVSEAILSAQVVSAAGSYGASQALTTPAWAKGIVASFTDPSGGAPAPSPTPNATPTPTPTPSPSPSVTPTPAPAPSPVAGLSIQPLNSYSAQLLWTAPLGVARVQILRNGRLLDDFTFAGGATLAYTDYLLWQSTAYSYELKSFDAGATLVGDVSGSVTTPTQSGSFPVLYGPASFWNQPIAANPAIDGNSAAMVSTALTAYASGANMANSDAWGKPLAYANVVSRLYAVGCTLYDCAISVAGRIPRYATPVTGSDHHLIVIDPTTNTELDQWESSYNALADAWSAGSRYIGPTNAWGANCGPGQHCNGAVAAGFAAFGGVVRPEEIAQGHIDHALFMAMPYTRSGFLACPATHTDGIYNDPAAIPEGAHLQLDPAFNVDAQPWPQYEKVIAHALQTYGAYVGDSGGTLSFAGEPNLDRGYDAWGLIGVPNPPNFSSLPWGQFRVLQLQAC